MIARYNGLTPNARLLPGQSLVLDNRHIVPAAPGISIVINIPQRMLFHVEVETAPVGYPIAVGRRDWPTPVGPFEIVAKEEHPTWDVPPSIQEEMRRSGQRVLTKVSPGPANPLGEFWFGLTLPGIGIHGTPAFTSIYRPVTHGCIRLHPEDIAELFPNVAVGTTGLIVYEPVLVAVVDGTLFLEVHPDVYRRAQGDMLTALRRHLEAGAFVGCVDWTAAREVIDRRDGIARAIGSSGPVIDPPHPHTMQDGCSAEQSSSLHLNRLDELHEVRDRQRRDVRIGMSGAERRAPHLPHHHGLLPVQLSGASPARSAAGAAAARRP